MPAMKREPSEALNRLRTEALAVLGENLVSLVIYGEAVSERGKALDGDVEAMIVLKTIDLVALNQVRRVVLEARREMELMPMVLTPSDLERSTDVFPVKFQTMKWRHLRVCGEDLLRDLAIDREHLRLRAEQEIKNLLLRLRRLYIERSHRGELLKRTLERGAESLVRDLAVLLYLRSGEVLDTEATVSRAAKELGIPAEPLERALAIGPSGAPDEVRRLYERFMTAVEQAAELLDQHLDSGA